MMDKLSEKATSGIARRFRTFVRRRTLVVLLLVPVFFTILLIAKSTTISTAQDLQFVDHRFGEPSTIRQSVKHDIPKNETNTFVGHRFGEPSTIQQAVKHDNPQNKADISVCFITSQFSSSRDKTDHLFDVRKTAPLLHKSPLYHFFAFSNLADLKAPGWEVVVKDLREYKRWITQSRWPKFLAFRDTTIRDTCQVVFYIDGILSPRDDLEIFQAESRRVMNSSIQLAQRIHPYGGGAEAEFDRIKLKKKDLKKNVNASLHWLQAQPDYDKNCALYENSIIGYSIDSAAFQKAANFFWSHYSKEEDSWRDQPLWCYTLDHFDITPMQLTGNGKGVLFDQVDSRTAKGSHKYKSESVILAANFYESLDQNVPTVQSCWLDTNITAADSSQKPTTKAHHLLTPICPDKFRRSMVPENRTHSGLTVSIPYFAQPALLLQQLNYFASYPKDIQKQLSIIIVDDGSPLGLRAMDHLNITTNDKNASHYLNNNQTSPPTPFYFMLNIVRINHSIDWNDEGSHNLAFYLTKTRLGLMLDLRMIVPIETIRDALTWDTAKINNETNRNQPVAHKFNRRRPNGKTEYQQTCALIDVQEFWNSGGMDEDFAGNFGYGTSTHFWHVWEQGGRHMEKHSATFLLEQDTDACDSSWLYSSEKAKECKTARSNMNSLLKEGKTNRRLWRKKSEGKIKWSNAYLRFNWTIDF